MKFDQLSFLYSGPCDSGSIAERIAWLAGVAADELEMIYGKPAFRCADGDEYLCLIQGGMIVSLLIWRNWEDERCAWIGMAWTLPNYRGRGFYRRLQRALVERSLCAGFETVRCGVNVLNTRSATVHESLGMRPVMFEVRL
jgi:RimJ/RimL family protein N-acetyltransferase